MLQFMPNFWILIFFINYISFFIFIIHFNYMKFKLNFNKQIKLNSNKYI